ncbi:MAG: hypothetical protein SVW57_14290, partial [Thermodesulfobacteriota bacterium]|nr:hypothetical protein [Thermodesulfobacteriota bacterium]
MDVKLYCTETYIGVKKIFDRFPCLRPFVGGGLYLVNMYIDISYDDELKNGIGGWVGVGVYVALSKHLDVGLEGRWSYAKIDVFGMKLDTGGIHFNLLVGYHF